MSKIKVAPASLVELAQMAEQVGASRQAWGVLKMLHETGATWAIYAGEAMIGMGMLGPIGPGHAEAAFHFSPGAERHMLAIVRAIRLTMDASPYRAIVTFCRSEAGKRIAHAAGFRFAEHSEFGEVWIYGHPGRGASETGNAEPAAHELGAAGGPAG